MTKRPKRRRWKAGQLFEVLGMPGKSHIVHSGTGQVHYCGGEPFTLDHLSDDQLEWFILRKVVQPVGSSEVDSK